MASSYTLNGASLIDAQVYEPRVGCWTADVEVDSDETFAGSVTLALGSVSLVGTVFRGGLEGGRWVGRIVGGAGGLSATLPPKNYAGATLQHVVDDIIRESGETLAAASASLTGEVRVNWHRTRGPAGHALQAVADELSVPWRMTRAGTILLGAQTATELDTETVEILERPDVGAMVVAPAEDPELLPGVLFGGREVSYVATVVEAGKLRQELWFDDTPGSVTGRIKGSLLRFIDAAVGRKLLYSYLWPCTVATQVGGALEVVPDDAEIRGGGLGVVYIRHGQPGYETTVPAGARCLVGFEAGDPKRPYVAQWLAGTAVTEVEFDGGSLDMARDTDPIIAGHMLWDATIPVIYWAPDILGVPGAYAPIQTVSNPGNPPNPGDAGTALTGTITGGNPKLKA